MTARTQTEQIYERLRASILSLELVPGESLTERGLEGVFSASRTPVRAGLMRLETEGLVQREGRGWIVAPIDLDEIRELAELREALETATARLAIDRASDLDIAAVAELLDGLGASSDEAEGVRAGADFHVELARLSGNRLMADAIAGAMTRLARTRWLEVRTAESRSEAVHEHRAIVEAIAARDVEGAVGLIAEHIRGTNERLIASLTDGRRRFRAYGLSIEGELRRVGRVPSDGASPEEDTVGRP